MYEDSTINKRKEYQTGGKVQEERKEEEIGSRALGPENKAPPSAQEQCTLRCMCDTFLYGVKAGTHVCPTTSAFLRDIRAWMGLEAGWFFVGEKGYNWS